MEKLEKRPLRLINDDFVSPLKDLLTSNNRTILHINRMKIVAQEVLRILHNLSPVYLQDLVNFKVSNYNFRRVNQAEVPRVNSTRYGLRTFRIFRYESVRIWNSLPNDIRTAESYPQFKRLLHNWNGSMCKCPMCSI